MPFFQCKINQIRRFFKVKSLKNAVFSKSMSVIKSEVPEGDDIGMT